MRKIVSVVASAVLAASLVPAAAFMHPQDALAAEVVHVSTTDDLRAIATRVSGGDSMEGVTILVDADLDFAGQDYFSPIGTYAKPFKGIFDGQGHTISNMSLWTMNMGGATVYLAPFGVARDATLRNFSLTGVSVSCFATAATFEALLCTAMTGCTVENCTVQGAVGAQSGSSVLSMGGACVSANDCTFRNCSFDYSKGQQATDQFSPSYPGSVIAKTASNGTVIDNCKVYGKVTSGNGALVGTLKDSTITNCTSYVTMSASTSSTGAGGLVGTATNSAISNCVNEGTFSASGSSTCGYAAGLVGCLDGSTLSNCINRASVSTSAGIDSYNHTQTTEGYAAGLVGVSKGNSTISSCVNDASVTSSVTAERHATSRVGGLVGKAVLTTIENCYNLGALHAVSTTDDPTSTFFDSACSAGGIGANLDSVCKVKNCYNVGKITTEFPTKSTNDPVIEAICPEGEASYEGCFYWYGTCESLSPHATALSASEMKTQASYAGWDFASTWKMDTGVYGLPVLSWETDAHDAVVEPEQAVTDIQISPIEAVTYTGEAFEPEVTVSWGGQQRQEGTEYTVSYENNVEAGTATVHVKAWGLYTGEASAQFQILKVPTSLKASLAVAKAKPGAKVAIAVEGAVGTVSYSCNKTGVTVTKAGKAKVAKKAAKGTYTITVKDTGDANHDAGAVTLKLKVLKA